MTINQIKQKIGNDILDAMNSIDNANHSIYDLPDNYGKEISELSKCKQDLKRILNNHFDNLAIQRTKSVSH